jgi:hypothetical protein
MNKRTHILRTKPSEYAHSCFAAPNEGFRNV